MRRRNRFLGVLTVVFVVGLWLVGVVISLALLAAAVWVVASVIKAVFT